MKARRPIFNVMVTARGDFIKQLIDWLNNNI